MKLLLPLFIGCLLALHVFAASAATRYVNGANPAPVAPYGTWATAATNIQDALDVAIDGDLVLVTNGVYQYGGAVTAGNTLLSRVCVTNAVSVQSVNGPAATIIVGALDPATGGHGSNAVRCALLTSGASLTGFSLTGGWTYATGNAAVERAGAGVYFQEGGMVSNCVLANNSAAGNGGAGYIYMDGLLASCLVVSNAANKGGGLFMRNGLVTGCTFERNTSETTGGGIHCRNSGVIEYCSFLRNTTVDDGAGVLCTENGLLRHSIIDRNRADGEYGTGGGVILYYGGSMDHCIIVSNYSRYTGGGVAIYAGNGSMNNCLVYRNICQNYGGGVYCYAGGGPIANCTIVENRSIYYYGGVNCNYTGIFYNCIIYYNTANGGASEIGGNHGVAYNCCISTNGGLVTVVNWFTNAPAFANRAADDFRLQPASSCISAGADNLAVSATDLDGVGRIVGPHVDVGCYEFHYDAPALAPPAVTQPRAVPAGTAGILTLTNTLGATITGTKAAGLFAGGAWVTNLILQNLAGTVWTQRVAALAIATNGAWSTFAYRTLSNDLYTVSTNQTVLQIVNYRLLPAVDVTNEDYWVTFDVSTGTIGGTNNAFVGGGMLWTNRQTHASGTFPAQPAWVVSNIGLQVGNNVIVIRGTNSLGDISEDSVTITRYQEGTGTPCVTITSGPVWVYYDVGNSQVRGTNCNIVGPLYWVNDRHADQTGSFAQGFTCNANNLEPGENLVTIGGTNVFGAVAADRVTLHRQTMDERIAFTNYVRLGNVTPVPPYDSWSTAATNIQDAINAGPGGLTGAVVIVSNGVYALAASVSLTTPVMVSSLNGPDVTILDGNAPANTNRCLLLNNSLAVATGFTVSNAYWTLNGGGAFIGANGGLLIRCVFVNCTAGEKGGGLYLNRAGKAEWCRFSGCSADTWGGGAHLEQGGEIYNSTFSGCYAVTFGGGVSMYGGGRLYTCLVTHNSANRGGGVYTRYYPSRLDNCSIVSNTAGTEGGGLYIREGADLRGSIVYYNAAPTNENFYRYGTIAAQDSCVYPKLGNPCITNEPQFVNVDGDYHLQASSPCINAAPVYNWMNGAEDLDGNPRVSGGYVDMGVYEVDTDPVVTITNPAGIVAYQTAQTGLGGSNSQWVAGMLWWSNAATETEAVLGPYSGATNWTIAAIGVTNGDNLIIVSGSNLWGYVTNDSVTIHRETYEEGLPRIATNALIFPAAGSVLDAGYRTNIVWNPLLIDDAIDGANVLLSTISIHVAVTSNQAATVSNDVANLASACAWFVPPSLIAGPAAYVVRFEVVDSSALTNSRVFADNAFLIVPEPAALWLLLAAGLVGRRRRNSACEVS